MTGAAWYASEAALVGALRGADGGGGRPGIDGYDDVREVFRGGQGTVSVATRRADGRRVAIKVVHDERLADDRERRRFEREIDVLSSLDHPHLVPILGTGTTADGLPYLVMPWIDGAPLDEHVLGPDRGGTSRLDVPATLRLLVRVCDAVHFAHQRGVMHRDLKPGNIRVTPEGLPVVLDFGLAAPVRAGARAAGPTITATGQFVGSLAWASPEQVEAGDDGIDLRTDVYSLGVILYQALTGRLPFDVSGPLRETIERIVAEDPVPPSGLRSMDEDVETIVLRCLAKDPGRRYQGADDIARDIRRHLAGEAIEARRDTAWFHARRALRRYRVATAVGSFLALVLAATTITMTVLYRATEAARAEARLQWAETGRQAANARSAVRFLEQVLTASDPAYREDAELSLRSVLDGAAARYRHELRGQRGALRDVAHTLGRAYLHLGAYDAADPLVEHAVALDGDFVRAVAPGTAAHHAAVEALVDSTSTLAMLRHAQNRLEDAEALYDDILTFGRAGARSVADTLRTRIDLANVLAAQGRYERAERLWRDVADDAATTPAGAEERDLALYYLGMTRLARGDPDDADRFLQAALEAMRTRYGDESAQAADCLAALARLELFRDRPAEAIDLAERALAIFEARFAPGHERASDCLVTIAEGQSQAGRLDLAEPFFQRAVAAHRATLGDRHTATARALERYATALLAAGDAGRAEPMFREALDVFRASRGPGDPDVAFMAMRLGCCLSGAGRLAEARPLLAEALPVLERHYGPEDPRTMTGRRCLAHAARD
jgi:tetratricopeptide (TPR) repeat protein